MNLVAIFGKTMPDDIHFLFTTYTECKCTHGSTKRVNADVPAMFPQRICLCQSADEITSSRVECLI